MTIAGAFRRAGAPDFDLIHALASEAGGKRLRTGHHQADTVTLGCGVDGQIAVHGTTSIVADARIDNRAELESALRAPPGLSGAELLLRAWERWSDDFLDHIHGDIACVIWTGAHLILGRDAMGRRPLHFCRAGRQWLFSSTPAGLLTHPAVPCVMDERHLAETIVQLPHEGTASPYRGISRVPPGHLAILSDDGEVRLHRHWRPERIALLRLADQRDYAEMLRDCLEEAVRCRLPASGPAACELSGGLDSASIASLAARILGDQGRSLVAYTAEPASPVDERLYPGRIVDEGALAALVARRYGNIEHVRISTRGRGSLFAMTDLHSLATREMEIPSPNGLWADAICEDAGRRGIHAVLEGGMGNLTASYDGLHHLPTMVRSGRFLALGRTWSGMHRWNKAEWPWTRLAFRSISPLMPGELAGFLRRAAGRASPDPLALYAINPDFARCADIPARLAAQAAGDTASDGVAWRLGMLDGDSGHVAANRKLHGVEFLDPMADRRLVELCLSIPMEQFLFRGEPRALIRAAMSGLVPDEILYEKCSGLQSADWPERFKEARADFAGEMARLEASPLANRVLDLPQLRKVIDSWPETTEEWHGRAARDGVLVALTQAFGAGRFLRQFETGNL